MLVFDKSCCVGRTIWPRTFTLDQETVHLKYKMSLKDTYGTAQLKIKFIKHSVLYIQI